MRSVVNRAKPKKRNILWRRNHYSDVTWASWAPCQVPYCGLRMHRECRERFPRHRRIVDPDMHHGTCMTHVPWCMPGSLTSSFLWSRWRGKRSRHSRRMRNPQFYVSGKRPIASQITDHAIAFSIHCSKYLREQWRFFYAVYMGSISYFLQL